MKEMALLYKDNRKNMFRWVLTLLFGGFIAYWWGVRYPYALTFQEQYQLFLFSGDYFTERLGMIGGLADYLGELFTQFFYYPALGATILAVLFMLLQRLVGRAMRADSLLAYALSFIPGALLLGFMGDENVLLSYPVALLVALAFARLKPCFWIDLVLVPLLYWLIGPMVAVFALLHVSGYRAKWMSGLLLLLTVALPFLATATVLQQWELANAFLGVNYYRIPYMLPNSLWVIPLVTLFVIAVGQLGGLKRAGESFQTSRGDVSNESGSHFKTTRGVVRASIMQVVVLGALGVYALTSFDYDADKYEIIRLDQLVRYERWDEIIRRAEQHPVEHPFASQCVNLALAMKRQLADRMFSFHQSGPNALIMPMVRDMVTDFPSAEAFYHLGMVNSAQRYMSDIQESILNYRKSGRCTKRITECLIINGKYDVARKHLTLLKQSLFYREWAKDTERYLGQEAWIDRHETWGKLRQFRYKDDFLYNYSELDKMFGLLFVNNPENKMALDYIMAQFLLNGNTQGFMEYMSWVQQYGGYSAMPAGYQDAVKCIQARGDAPGSAYANYAKRMVGMKQEKTEHEAH